MKYSTIFYALISAVSAQTTPAPVTIATIVPVTLQPTLAPTLIPTSEPTSVPTQLPISVSTLVTTPTPTEKKKLIKKPIGRTEKPKF
jgi:hypothetical protein